MSRLSPCDPLPTDDNIGNILLIPAAIFTVPSAITTVLRLWARRDSPGSDDWMTLVAAIMTITLNALCITGVKHGQGRHICFLNDKFVADVTRDSWVNMIIFFWALFFIKTSVCLLVLRVKSTRALRWVSGMVISLMIASTLVCCVALLVECKPVSAFWNRDRGQCRAPTFRIYSIWIQAAFSVFTDLTCSLLPFSILWNLQLSCRKKVVVGSLMVLGVIASIFSLLRATSLSLGLRDTTYDYTITGTWMTLEANIGLIASNIGPMYTLICCWTQSKQSNAHGTQDFPCNVRKSRLDARLQDDNESDHSLFSPHTEDRKHDATNGSISVSSVLENIQLDCVHTCNSEGSPEHRLSKW